MPAFFSNSILYDRDPDLDILPSGFDLDKNTTYFRAHNMTEHFAKINMFYSQTIYEEDITQKQ